MLTPEILVSFGFERLMQGYWKKDNYGLLEGYDDKGIYYVNFNSIIRTLEELKEDYRKKTGKELY